MTLYHVNPATNRPNVCRTPDECAVAATHYETQEAARESAKVAVATPAPVAETAPAVEVKKAATPKAKAPAKKEAAKAEAPKDEKPKVKKDSKKKDAPKKPKPAPAPVVEVPVAEEVVEAPAPRASKSVFSPEIEASLAEARGDKPVTEVGKKAPAASAIFEEAEKLKDRVVETVTGPEAQKVADNVRDSAVAGAKTLGRLGNAGFTKAKGFFSKLGK